MANVFSVGTPSVKSEGGVQGVEFSQLPAASQIDRELETVDTSPLRSDLKHTPVAPHGIGQDLALAHRHRTGLFAVDVLARFRRHDRGQGVPAVARGDQHGVDVASCEQFTKVAIRGAILVAVLGVDHVLDRLAPIGPDIADGHKPRIRQRQQRTQDIGAAAVDPDAAHRDPLAGGHAAILAECRTRNEHGSGQYRADLGGRGKKPPPRHR